MLLAAQMSAESAPALLVCWEAFLVLAVGTALVVGLAAVVGTRLRSAVWQRTVWQAAVAGLGLLVVAELTGVGRGLVALAELALAGLARPSPAGQSLAIQHAEDIDSAAEHARRTFPPSSADGAREAAPGVPARAKSAVLQPSASSPRATAFPVSDGCPLRTPPSREEPLHTARRTSPLPEPGIPGWAEPWAHSAAEPIGPVEPLDIDPAQSFDSPQAEQPAAFGGPSLSGAGRMSSGPVTTGAPEPEHLADRVCRVSHQRESFSKVPFPADAVSATQAERPALKLLAAVWLAGTVVLLARQAWSRVRLHWFVARHTSLAEGQLLVRAESLARRLGLVRRVRVLVGQGLEAPVAFGLLRPTMVLPLDFQRRHSVCQQEAILAHELAHLSAGDSFWLLLSGMVRAMLWWHPLAWYARQALCDAAETAADEAALVVPEGPSALADCLVSLGRRMAAPRRYGWVAVRGSGFRSRLGRRVERLLNLSGHAQGGRPSAGRLHLTRMLLPAVLVVLVLCSTAWTRVQVPVVSEGGSTMGVIRSTWRHSLAAAVMLALWSSAGHTAAEQATTDQPSRPEGVAAADLSKANARRPKRARAKANTNGPSVARVFGSVWSVPKLNGAKVRR